MKRAFAIALAVVFTLGLGVAASHAANVTGRYNYVEKGHTGTMVIKMQGKFFVFSFKTTDKSSGQMCEFDAAESGPRTEDDRPAVGSSDSGVRFKISIKGDTAMVDVEEKGDECGMSGYFGGKYVKAKK